MRIDPAVLRMTPSAYQQRLEDIRYSAEVRRCLASLDVDGMRKIWAQAAPGLPQPESYWDVLHAMHLARTHMQTISAHGRRYSEHWLRERERRTIVAAVGVSVKPITGHTARSRNIEAAMSEAVLAAYKDGVDLDLEAGEVKRRMAIAKNKEWHK